MLARRFYGDRRVNGAFLRKGFKDWVDKGFPRDPVTAAAPKELMRRGWDSWVKVSHEEAFAYHAKTLMNIAQTYSGEDGTKRLLAQGYDPDMVAAAGGAGTRVMKFRGGMGNSMALLDQFVRKAPEEKAMGSGSSIPMLSTPTCRRGCVKTRQFARLERASYPHSEQ